VVVGNETITEISDQYDYTYIRSAKDFVTRKWYRFPVQTHADWEGMRPRYDPADPARLPDAETCAALAASERALTISLNGPFWQLREWLGMENLCMLFRDDPTWVAEMIATWQAFTLDVLERVMRRVRVDALCVSEDMAYKAHSMISPAMARRFLQPTYRAWQALCQAYDVPLLNMDSDGYILELVPVWLETGFNCCNPIEVAAGNDLVAMRRRFGRSMAYHGGIDKRALAAGGAVMRQELVRVVPPLLVDGGYIPGCDHGVPPDIAWPDFVAYTGALAELCGWR
jgi:uroporphyrinogen decarboxylase